MSAFAIAIHWESVLLAARFAADPKPRFSSDAIRFAHPKRSRTRSGDPSLDALSTTQTSARPLSTSGLSDSRQRASRSRVFHETTATVTAGDGEDKPTRL